MQVNKVIPSKCWCNNVPLCKKSGKESEVLVWNISKKKLSLQEVNKTNKNTTLWIHTKCFNDLLRF